MMKRKMVSHDAHQIDNATDATSSMVITSEENMESVQNILQLPLNNTLYNLLCKLCAIYYQELFTI